MLRTGGEFMETIKQQAIITITNMPETVGIDDMSEAFTHLHRGKRHEVRQRFFPSTGVFLIDSFGSLPDIM